MDANLYAVHTDGMYRAWQLQEVSSAAALAAFTDAYARLDDQITALEQQRDALRVPISEIVAHIGGTVTVPDFGHVSITAPAVSSAYNKADLDALVAELDAVQPEIAKEIRGCLRTTMKAGSLRISRQRKG